MARPREYDRDEVVDAAMRVFGTRGYAGSSVSDLQAATGLCRASLYGTFGDKEGLLRAALASYTERFAVQLGLARDDAPPLRAFLLATLDMNECGGPGCFVSQLALELENLPETARNEVCSVLSRTDRLVEEIVRESQRLGEIGPAHDPELIARLVTVFQRGLGLVSRHGPTKTDLRARVEAFVGLLGGQ